MLAALRVLKKVGTEADADFIAVEIIPLLWNMALGPLLDLAQFKQFMELINSLGAKVEQEHSRKLQELSGSNSISRNDNNQDIMSFGDLPAAFTAPTGNDEDDFERLVTGRYGGSVPSTQPAVADAGWDTAPPTSRAKPTLTAAPAFSWSTTASPAPGPPSPGIGSLAAAMKPQQQGRTVTPDTLSRFGSLQPQSTQYSQPLQPSRQTSFNQPLQPSQPQQPAVNWQAAQPSANPWASTTAASPASSFSPTQPPKPNYTSTNSNLSMASMNNSMSGLSMASQQRTTSQPTTPFSLPPPPTWSQPAIQPQAQTQAAKQPDWGAFKAPAAGGQDQGAAGQQQGQGQKKGLDAWESLI